MKIFFYITFIFFSFSNQLIAMDFFKNFFSSGSNEQKEFVVTVEDCSYYQVWLQDKNQYNDEFALLKENEKIFGRVNYFKNGNTYFISKEKENSNNDNKNYYKVVDSAQYNLLAPCPFLNKKESAACYVQDKTSNDIKKLSWKNQENTPKEKLCYNYQKRIVSTILVPDPYTLLIEDNNSIVKIELQYTPPKRTVIVDQQRLHHFIQSSKKIKDHYEFFLKKFTNSKKHEKKKKKYSNITLTIDSIDAKIQDNIDNLDEEAKKELFLVAITCKSTVDLFGNFYFLLNHFTGELRCMGAHLPNSNDPIEVPLYFKESFPFRQINDESYTNKSNKLNYSFAILDTQAYSSPYFFTLFKWSISIFLFCSLIRWIVNYNSTSKQIYYSGYYY